MTTMHGKYFFSIAHFLIVEIYVKTLFSSFFAQIPIYFFYHGFSFYKDSSVFMNFFGFLKRFNTLKTVRGRFLLSATAEIVKLQSDRVES